MLQQYLSARQLRDMTAAERGVPSPSCRYGSVQPGPHQPGAKTEHPAINIEGSFHHPKRLYKYSLGTESHEQCQDAASQL